MSNKIIRNRFDGITFDDVLINPKFSRVSSRKSVSVENRDNEFLGLNLPVISANMDTVTGSRMAKAMAEYGAIGCLHRFMDIETNIAEFNKSIHGKTKPIISVGIGVPELERAEALFNAGATAFCIDIAHGAQIQAVEQYKKLLELVKTNAAIIVGNFATSESIDSFNYFSGTKITPIFKIGIGPGSACTTRIKTGVGVPQLSAILDCSENGRNKIIADGGCKTAGDVSKAFAAGADYVMLGGMLAGTDETPGEVINGYKVYRGSASKESYESQKKEASWRTSEGESFKVACKGSVNAILSDIEGGLRSAMAYTNCLNLKEFRSEATFSKISVSTIQENKAHGKT